jgi:antitoxin component of MazEF toxin-antitoxin module
MTITSTQKVIKIGSSAGVTIPAKDLKRGNVRVGDEVNIIIEKSRKNPSDENERVLEAAKDILKRYKQDFENLARR